MRNSALQGQNKNNFWIKKIPKKVASFKKYRSKVTCLQKIIIPMNLMKKIGAL